MRTLSFFFIMLMSIFIYNTNAYASYTCNVTITAIYSDNGTGRTYTVYDKSFSQSGIARFDGGTPSRTQKCMKTAWESTFPNYLNETAVTDLLNQFSLSTATKTYFCNGGGFKGRSTPPTWANSDNGFFVKMDADKILGNGTRTTRSDAWIPKKWCADFEAAQAAAQAEQDAAQAAADAEQAEQDAYNAACLTCLYTWDKKYHSCAIKMGFKYSSTASISLAGSIGETAADAISEAQCKQRSNYIRRHKPDTSTLPYDVTIPPVEPISATNSLITSTVKPVSPTQALSEKASKIEKKK